MTDLEAIRESWEHMGISFVEWTEPNATYPRIALEISPTSNLPYKWFEFDSRGRFLRSVA